MRKKTNTKIKGFTLSEVLTTIVVIGFLITLLMPTVNNLIPDKSKMLFKKAYLTAEETISEIINDDGLYPVDATNVGFMYTTMPVSVDGVSYSGTTKFCKAFASKADLSGAENCGTGFDFTTPDGITWDLPVGAFTLGGSQTITVDVLGGTTNTNKNNPNCTYNATTCTNPDRFNIYIYNDGKIAVKGTKELELLDINPPPATLCEGGQIFVNGSCQCPAGQSFVNNICVFV